MANRRPRRAFPTTSSAAGFETERFHADEPVGGAFGFFRDHGTRETIESIIIAVMLALIFKAFETEAFIIPTGSMAPSLQGQHKDLECESCHFRYRVGCSSENAADPKDRDHIESTFCPICQFETRMKPRSVADHTSNKGDRIIVNKFIYDFMDPERYDVIVFKNPNKGSQNYIKRLIGLPGDNILIENGDIYLMHKQEDDTWRREITRKPPHKMKCVLQTIDDTHHIAPPLKDVGWPSRWQQFDHSQPDQWTIDESGKNPVFSTQASENAPWLRYRHLRPYKSEWELIEIDSLPPRFADNRIPAGRLIGDHYAYNDGRYAGGNRPLDMGLHWVGDLGLEAWAEVQSSSGQLMLDLVEGGAHFTCTIDIATGKATLSCDDPEVRFSSNDGQDVATPQGTTSIRGKGTYHIEFLNADDRLHLWVDHSLIEFDASDFSRPGIVMPSYSPENPGDAEPAGIAAKNLDLRLTRLKIVRDIYYTSARGAEAVLRRPSDIENETREPNTRFIVELMGRPDQWESEIGRNFFRKAKGRTRPMFELAKGDTPEKDQFLPLGDNSPASLDGRVWDGLNYVERDMLIGRALFIYWPHTLNEPIPYFPNFWRMGFIR